MMKHCNICKMGIDTSKERYIIIEDKEGVKSLSKVYMHKNCWHEWATQKENAKKMMSQSQKIIEKAKRMCGIDDEVVVVG